MVSCLNSTTSFTKTCEVLLDSYLIDLLLKEKYVLPAMTPVSLKLPEFLRGKSEFGLLAICSQTFPLSVVLAFKTIWFCYENFPY